MFTKHHELHLRGQINADKKDGVRFYTTAAGEISNPTEAALNEIARLQHALTSAKTHLEANDDPLTTATAALDVLRSAAR